MHSALFALALAAGAATASPLYKRQDNNDASTISVVATATVTPGMDPASTPGLTPTAAGAGSAATTYPLYPCPMGYLLTYAQANMTLGQPIDVTNQQVGEWADAIIFPNLTASEGGSTIGATHTWNIAGIPYNEVLVNSTNEGGSAYVQYVYNSTAPVTAGDVTFGNYQAVYKAYDPTYPITGMRGPSTFVQIFINACANNQDAARPLLQQLLAAQLGQLSGDAGNGGVLVTSVLSTDSLTATETNTAIATNTNTDIASETVLATASAQVTQTNTVIPAVTSVVANTNQVTTTAATAQVTVTPITQTATTVAVTNTNTVATVAVTSGAVAPSVAVVTVATTTTSV